jgi:hypothetical protein
MQIMSIESRNSSVRIFGLPNPILKDKHVCVNAKFTAPLWRNQVTKLNAKLTTV